MVRPDARRGLGAARPQRGHAVRAAHERLLLQRGGDQLHDARADRRALPRRRGAERREPQLRRTRRAVPDRPEQGRVAFARARHKRPERQQAANGGRLAPCGPLHAPRRRCVFRRGEPDDRDVLHRHAHQRLRDVPRLDILLREPGAVAARRGARAPQGPHARRCAEHDDVSVLQPPHVELHKGYHAGRDGLRSELRHRRVRRGDNARAGGCALSDGARRCIRTLPLRRVGLLPPSQEPALRVGRPVDDGDARRGLDSEHGLRGRAEVRDGGGQDGAGRRGRSRPHGAQDLARPGRRNRRGVLRRRRRAGLRIRRVGGPLGAWGLLQLGCGELPRAG